jgi:hypothetical protein
VDHDGHVLVVKEGAGEARSGARGDGGSSGAPMGSPVDHNYDPVLDAHADPT